MQLLLPKVINIDTSMDNLLSQIARARIKDIVSLSFNEIKDLTPEALIMLIVLSKHINTITKEQVLWKNIDLKLYPYLEVSNIYEIPFIRIMQLPFINRLNLLHMNFDSINSLNNEIKIMTDPCHIVEMIKFTEHILQMWFPDRIESDRLIRQVKDYIMNIAGNSLEHSCGENGTGTCYYSLQKERTNSGPQVKLIFGDVGIGIRRSLQIYNTNVADWDHLAIEDAFIKGYSGRRDQNGGLGFIKVRNTLENYGGEIAIRSGAAVFKYDPKDTKPKKRKLQYSLPGTQTVFVLN